MATKTFTIKITDTDVYIDDERCYFSSKMDKENHEDDLNKKAIVALANKMGYESILLFEEMADRLDEMTDESDEVCINNYLMALHRELLNLRNSDNFEQMRPSEKYFVGMVLSRLDIQRYSIDAYNTILGLFKPIVKDESRFTNKDLSFIWSMRPYKEPINV